MNLHTAFLQTHRRQFDMLVIGGANTDCVMKVDSFPQIGEASLADHFQCLPGGKGLNQAIAAARLGAKVALIAMLGDDHHADEIRERLAAEGVDTRFVLRTRNVHTGATTLLVNKLGQSLRTAFPGANRLLLPQDITAASNLMEQAGIVLAQLEIPLPTVRHAFHLARRSDVVTMLDAGPPVRLDAGLLQDTVILRANADEIAAAAGMSALSPQAALEAARVLLAQGPEVIAVGTGDGGNAVLTSDALFMYAADATEAEDNAGAGDAFSAAFALGLLEGKDVQSAGAMAHAASGYAIATLGALASLPSRRELDERRASQQTSVQGNGFRQS